jgi:glycosyltransferase involved in cell wall biosynthesis
MKLLFITDSLRQDITGVGIYNLGLINSIIKFFPKIEYKYLDYEENWLNYNNLLLIKNQILIRKKFLWYNYLSYILNKLKNDYNYVFNLTGTPHFLKYPIKEILVIHDLHPLLYPKFTRFRTTIYNKLFLYQTLRNSYKIIVNSDKTKKELLDLFQITPKKIFKIFIPPRIETKNTSTKNQLFIEIVKKPYFLYIGNIDIRKNLINLIKSFNNLIGIGKFNEYSLILAGKPSYGYEKIRQIVIEYNLQRKVLFTGYISEKDKRFLLAKCKVFIYISSYEGLGIPVYEAAFFKKPIVSSKNIPMVTEFFENKVVLINPIDIQSITDGLKIAAFQFNKNWIDFNYFRALYLSNPKIIKQKIIDLYNFLSS